MIPGKRVNKDIITCSQQQLATSPLTRSCSSPGNVVGAECAGHAGGAEYAGGAEDVGGAAPVPAAASCDLTRGFIVRVVVLRAPRVFTSGYGSFVSPRHRSGTSHFRLVSTSTTTALI